MGRDGYSLSFPATKSASESKRGNDPRKVTQAKIYDKE